MIPLRLVSPIVVSWVVFLIQVGTPVQAEELRSTPYSLPEILALAVERSPTLAGAAGVVKEGHGQQITAGAFPNPILSGGAGKGSIRDPSTGVSIVEHTVTVEQPFE